MDADHSAPIRSSMVRLGRGYSPSPLPVSAEHVVLRRYDGMAGIPTVMSASQGNETLRGSVVIELRVTPPPGVRKSFAVPRHEIHVMQRSRYGRRSGRFLTHCRIPMDLRHF